MPVTSCDAHTQDPSRSAERQVFRCEEISPILDRSVSISTGFRLSRQGHKLNFVPFLAPYLGSVLKLMRMLARAACRISHQSRTRKHIKNGTKSITALTKRVRSCVTDTKAQARPDSKDRACRRQLEGSSSRYVLRCQLPPRPHGS
jgi:hypothetical protein